MPARFGIAPPCASRGSATSSPWSAFAALGVLMGLGVTLLGRRRAGGGAPRLRAFAGLAERSLAPRRGLLQRQRLHRGDPLRGGAGGPLDLSAGMSGPPLGTGPDEGASFVATMFSRIAGRYDLDERAHDARDAPRVAPGAPLARTIAAPDGPRSTSPPAPATSPSSCASSTRTARSSPRTSRRDAARGGHQDARDRRRRSRAPGGRRRPRAPLPRPHVRVRDLGLPPAQPGRPAPRLRRDAASDPAGRPRGGARDHPGHAARLPAALPLLFPPRGAAHRRRDRRRPRGLYLSAPVGGPLPDAAGALGAHGRGRAARGEVPAARPRNRHHSRGRGLSRTHEGPRLRRPGPSSC